jgi:hypothetical protein
MSEATTRKNEKVPAGCLSVPQIAEQLKCSIVNVHVHIKKNHIKVNISIFHPHIDFLWFSPNKKHSIIFWQSFDMHKTYGFLLVGFCFCHLKFDYFL